MSAFDDILSHLDAVGYIDAREYDILVGEGPEAIAGAAMYYISDLEAMIKTEHTEKEG